MLPLKFLGGGSNIIFPDAYLDMLVVKISMKGISFLENKSQVKAMAGENWDNFVKLCVNHGLQGIECLSGIPGSVGATPIQNVGAYGQEVSDTIKFVNCLDVISLNEISIDKTECGFGYRTSRFKTKDKNRFIITSVVFQLYEQHEPELTYKDIKNAITEIDDYSSLSRLEKLKTVRNKVIKIRRTKSMVINQNDPDTSSCGSFFTNPVLTKQDFENFIGVCDGLNLVPPFYKLNGKFKVPAAWLIEKSGFGKGYSENDVGISARHSLALVNRGGGYNALINLAEKIKSKVKEKFGIKLCEEPVIVRQA